MRGFLGTRKEQILDRLSKKDPTKSREEIYTEACAYGRQEHERAKEYSDRELLNRLITLAKKDRKNTSPRNATQQNGNREDTDSRDEK